MKRGIGEEDCGGVGLFLINLLGVLLAFGFCDRTKVVSGWLFYFVINTKRIGVLVIAKVWF